MNAFKNLNTTPIVVKGGPTINRYKEPKIQVSAALGNSITGEDYHRRFKRKHRHEKDFKGNKSVKINVTLVRKPGKDGYYATGKDGYYAIRAPDSRVYVYANEKPMSLAKFVNISIGQQGHPTIGVENYVNTEKPPPLRTINNIGFFLMIEMPFNGKKYLVSNIFAFQQNMFELMKGFEIMTGFPRDKVACYAINKTTYDPNDATVTYAVYGFSILFDDGIWKEEYGEEKWMSTIMDINTFNSRKVNLIDEYSENSESENRIIGGPFEDLLKKSLALGIKIVEGEEDGRPEDEIVVEGEGEGGEEEEGGTVFGIGGTRKKKIKSKRKKQRSKRRKHRSQKKSNRSLKHRQ